MRRNSCATPVGLLQKRLRRSLACLEESAIVAAGAVFFVFGEANNAFQ